MFSPSQWMNFHRHHESLACVDRLTMYVYTISKVDTGATLGGPAGPQRAWPVQGQYKVELLQPSLAPLIYIDHFHF